jgi:DNA-binding NtrC family response regulator
MNRECVVLSWIAKNNDPFDSKDPQAKSPGPSLTLLFDAHSPFSTNVHTVVFFHDRDAGMQAFLRTRAQIHQRDPSIEVEGLEFTGEDPTDHRAIYEFLRPHIVRIRERFAKDKLVIHASPGTPAMHTVWVLMAETGMINGDFAVVKSYRPGEKAGHAVIASLSVGLETYYRVYQNSRPLAGSAFDEPLFWDPKKFQCALLRNVFRDARRYAALNVPVLIMGERGTGKTTLAGWIRSNSRFRVPKNDGSWPAIACGQYSAETMRAELFGYRRGAFTGASSDHQGLLEAADGDTLFLDEIGDVSRDLQRLLIKAIEEKRFQRLGETRARKSNFRLLVATNLSFNELRKRIDPDFYDRVAPLRIRMPSLREIPQDLPWIWNSVSRRASIQACGVLVHPLLPKKQEAELLRRLAKHSLSGNLRDLFSIAFRCLACRDECTPSDALDWALTELANATTPDSDSSPLHNDGGASSKECDRLPAQELVQEFKAALAAKIYEVAKRRNLSPAEICDLPERTLRAWRRLRQ